MKAYRWSDYRPVYAQVVRLGLPIFVGQLGMIVVSFADNIMVGRYSTEALASASFVNNVFNMVMLACMGFTYGVLPLTGALFSRGDWRGMGSMLRNAAALNTIYALGLTGLMGLLYFNLHRLGQPAGLLPLIRPYYMLALCGVLPVAWFGVLSQWCYSAKNTVVPMWIVLGANALNVAGNYALIYGHFGLPELGLSGAGLSTLASRWACALAILVWFLFAGFARRCRLGFARGRLDGRQLRRVWATSLPVSLQLAFETAAFSGAAVLVGWLGAVPLAAFQIIVVVGMLGFCLYYAVGSAIAVVVSQGAGRGDCQAMRRAGWGGYHVMLALAALSTTCFIVFARGMMHLFTDDPAVLALALTLLVPLALYQAGDATQVAFANALRGTSRVLPMLWIAFVSYIVVGLPSTWLLGFVAGLGTWGVVLSFSVSLVTAAVLYLVFFLRATRQHTWLVGDAPQEEGLGGH